MADNANTSWLGKKVGGVPVLYIASAVAVILAVLAWQTLHNKKQETTANTTGAPTDAEIAAGEANKVPAIIYGSVSSDPAGQLATTSSLDNSSITTNDVWFHRAEAYLIAQGYTAGDAQLALQHYIQGADLSFEQGQMRDAAIKELGLPPTVTDSGITAPKVTAEQKTATVSAQRAELTKRMFRETLGKEASPVDIAWWDKFGPPTLDWPSWRNAGVSASGGLPPEMLKAFNT